MNANDLYESRNDFFLKPSEKVDKLMWVLLVVGVVLLVGSTFIKGDGEPATKVWGALFLRELEHKYVCKQTPRRY